MPRSWPRRGRVAWLCVAGLFADVCASDAVQVPKFHAVTYSNVFDPRLVLPMSSSLAHGFQLQVLGFGEEMGWGPKSGKLLNAYRDYLFSKSEPDDVVLLFDAFDVVFQGSEAEILEAYLAVEKRTGREVIYNGDVVCSSPRIAEYPPCDTVWRYLNGGVIIGRVRSLRLLFKDAVGATILDSKGKPMRNQNWHTDFFLAHQDLVMVDTRCEIMQVVMSLPSITGIQRPREELALGDEALYVSDGKLRNKQTGSVPAILHFPGPGHWPQAFHPERVGTCLVYEYFREHVNPGLLLLMEKQSTGTAEGVSPWKQICTLYLTPFDRASFAMGRLGDSFMRFSSNQGAVLVLLMMCLVTGALCYKVRGSRVHAVVKEV